MKKKFITPVLILSVCFSVNSASAQDNDNISRVVEASNHIIFKQPERPVIDSLISTLPTLTIDDAIAAVNSDMDERQITKIVDAIYLVNNLRNGNSLETSRDAISFTSLFPFRHPNSLDIAKLKDIFTSDSPTLHKTYLNKFPFVFRNCGPMIDIINLWDTIDANVAECEEKKATRALFDSYIQLIDGSKAPLATLYDKEGNTHSLSEYLGKTVVIDVWATWCHNCLKKMPAMMELRDKYAEKGNVVFLTVSIDRRDKQAAWDKISEKYSLHGNHNLIVNSDKKSDFEESYKIFGIPRYIVIRPDGTLADAYAPGPGEDLTKLIDSTLK